MDWICAKLMTRRDSFVMMGALTSLVVAGSRGRALAGPVRSEIPKWLRDADGISGALRGGTIRAEDWREQLAYLFNRVELTDILKNIDFERLRANFALPELGVSTLKVDFGVDVRTLRFYPKVFGMDTGRAIIPHGHANMVSAHLILAGNFHLRQYDQISRSETSLSIRPSVDAEIKAGALSSIGNEKDNVHWFIAKEPAYTLDLIMTGLDEAQSPNYDIFNLDMDEAVSENGLLRVPRLGVSEALRKYG